jgi:hypothetical protein
MKWDDHLATAKSLAATSLAQQIAEKPENRHLNRRSAKINGRKPKVNDLILSAARRFARDTDDGSFSVEDLAYAAWKYSGVSMESYDFPDTHRVSGVLFGAKGLVGRGLLVRVGAGRYRLQESATVE